jgi:hypothetical protein
MSRFFNRPPKHAPLTQKHGMRNMAVELHHAEHSTSETFGDAIRQLKQLAHRPTDKHNGFRISRY